MFGAMTVKAKLLAKSSSLVPRGHGGRKNLLPWEHVLNSTSFPGLFKQSKRDVRVAIMLISSKICPE
jgi:hypothetical protein